MNEANIMVDYGSPPKLLGLLDLGDTHRAPRIFDLCNAMLYMLQESYHRGCTLKPLEGKHGRVE